MSKPNRKPILNADLPPQFRQIRIVLAREPGHPPAGASLTPYPDHGSAPIAAWRSAARAFSGIYSGVRVTVHRTACGIRVERTG